MVNPKEASQPTFQGHSQQTFPKYANEKSIRRGIFEGASSWESGCYPSIDPVLKAHQNTPLHLQAPLLEEDLQGL